MKFVIVWDSARKYPNETYVYIVLLTYVHMSYKTALQYCLKSYLHFRVYLTSKFPNERHIKYCI